MTPAKTIKFVVVTPEQRVLEDTADFVVIPAHDGELGVLVDRAPLMCELGIGQMRYRKAGQTRRLFIDGGFAQVHENSVTVLAEHAVLADKVTGEMVAEARRAFAEAPTRTPEEAEARYRAGRRVAVLRDLRGIA